MSALNLPEYQSHKRVRAGLILEVALDNVDQPTHGTLLIDGPALQSHRVTAEWIDKHQPEIGGYLVVYADGYESYSPPKAFREGYARVQPFQEELVRFCPDCGRVGEVPAGARDCCPDGSHARRIPKKLAEACRDTFRLALDGIKPAQLQIGVEVDRDGATIAIVEKQGDTSTLIYQGAHPVGGSAAQFRTITSGGRAQSVVTPCDKVAFDPLRLYNVPGGALPEIEAMPSQVRGFPDFPRLAASAPDALIQQANNHQMGCTARWNMKAACTCVHTG